MEGTVSQQDYNIMQQAYEKSVEQGEQSDPNSLYADVMREDKVNNILEQINPDHLMIDIEHRIRGEKKDPYTKEWVQSTDKKKKVSEKLISNFMSYLGSILNQNTSLSNFSPEEINNLMAMVITYIKNDLSDNDEKYGIKGDFNEMSRIANIISFNVFAVLKQAVNGMLVRRFFSSLRVNEALNQGQSKSKWDALKFW